MQGSGRKLRSISTSGHCPIVTRRGSSRGYSRYNYPPCRTCTSRRMSSSCQDSPCRSRSRSKTLHTSQKRQRDKRSRSSCSASASSFSCCSSLTTPHRHSRPAEHQTCRPLPPAWQTLRSLRYLALLRQAIEEYCGATMTRTTALPDQKMTRPHYLPCSPHGPFHDHAFAPS
jgi:hypothetical protein